MWMANTSIQQSHIVVNLGNCSYRRAWIMCRSLLIDRYSRREPIDVVDIWLFHFIQELTSISGQRFYITALSFSKDGVEGKATFARA